MVTPLIREITLRLSQRVWSQCTNVTDGQTTDDSNTALWVASRGKKNRLRALYSALCHRCVRAVRSAMLIIITANTGYTLARCCC